MTLKHVSLACFAIAVLAVACKKEPDEQLSTAERIQARWSLESFRFHEHVDNEDFDTTAPALTSDYFDIRSDNKIYTSIGQNKDTLDYVLQNDSTVLIRDFAFINDDGIYKIRNLTNNTLTLHLKEHDPAFADDYVEIAFNLKK